MGFQLVIAEGKEAGREFVFDQLSVLIGRTSECDVVLYDPGVSRKHARIFSEGQEYYVEDMGSSNGTKVNGSIIKKKQLADGDAISLGPVVFNYSGVSLEPETASTDHGEDKPPEQHTRVVSAAEVKQRSRNKGVAGVPEGATPDQLKEVARTSTRTMQAIAKPRTSNPQAALVRNQDSGQTTETPQPRGSGGGLAGRRTGTPSGNAGRAISAADKARLKRKSGGAVGGFRIFWAEANKTKRIITGTLIALVSAGAIGGGVYSVLPEKGPERTGVEQGTLSVTPIEDSFGLSADGDPDPVRWPRADQKVFDFAFTSPVKAVVIVHYQARDISANEVILSVNGADITAIAPDTMAAGERAHEAVVPSNILKKGEPNKVVFDNVNNPPGTDPWRIWNVWVEVQLLPELPEDQLVQEANTMFKKAQEMFERRDVGAANRWGAYRSYREAWLMLEAHPDPKPPTFALAREKMKEAQIELDRQCSKLLLGAQGAYNQRQFEAARIELEHVHEFFPEKKHPCPFRADSMRESWGL
jgi:pSer/pThr/pTyr-binding forkhead associated (FHA) protein